jgi:hypothetical protein
VGINVASIQFGFGAWFYRVTLQVSNQIRKSESLIELIPHPSLNLTLQNRKRNSPAPEHDIVKRAHIESISEPLLGILP